MDTIRVTEERESEPILHEVDQSFQTHVKEVVESDAYDISVPTSTITDVDEECDNTIKEPIPSTSEQSDPKKKHIDPAMLQSIREVDFLPKSVLINCWIKLAAEPTYFLNSLFSKKMIPILFIRATHI